MRITLTIAAIAATMATAATARTTTMHHHAMRTDNGSSATRELNEKSLQMASAGGSMGGQSMANPSTMAPADTPPMVPAATPQ